jgi:hypothetical protein
MRTKKTVQETQPRSDKAAITGLSYLAMLDTVPITDFLCQRLISIFGNDTWAIHSYNENGILTEYETNISDDTSLADDLYHLRDTHFSYADLELEAGFRFGRTAVGTYELMRVLDVLRPIYLTTQRVPVYHPGMRDDFNHTMLRELYGCAPEALMGDNAYEANNANADRLYLLTAIKVDTRSAELDTKYGRYSSI